MAKKVGPVTKVFLSLAVGILILAMASVDHHHIRSLYDEPWIWLEFLFLAIALTAHRTLDKVDQPKESQNAGWDARGEEE